MNNIDQRGKADAGMGQEQSSRAQPEAAITPPIQQSDMGQSLNGAAGKSVRVMNHTPDLHAQIMNIPCTPGEGLPSVQRAYKEGHRDARHVAAELANEADETIATLRTAIQTQAEEASKLMAHRDELIAAAKNLRDVKGRHHSEQAFNRLCDVVAAITNAEATNA